MVVATIMWKNKLLIFFKYYNNFFFPFFPIQSLCLYTINAQTSSLDTIVQRQQNLLQLHLFYFPTTYLLPIFLFYSHQHTQLNYFLLFFFFYFFFFFFCFSFCRRLANTFLDKNSGYELFIF